MVEKVSRFDRWKEKYSFDKCELNNKEYGSYLSSYLRSQKKPLVLNINGSWGTGKTHFLKQMYSDLRFKHEYPVIYIDAWRSDFSNDPLLVLISEFIEQFKNLSSQINANYYEKQMLKVAAKFSKKLWNMSAIGVGTYLSEKTDNGAMVEAAKTLTFSDADAIQIGRNLTDNYKAQLSAIEDTKKVLEEYLDCFSGDKSKRKVYVLVDELDRCRPTYAIEMLETIKHFFSLDNYIFVVATDTNQLSHSIKAVYGSEFDGTEYLSRFFNRSAALPEPDKGLFAKLLVQDTLLDNRKQDIGTFDCLEYSADYLSRLLNEVSIMYNLSLRRMEQVFRKFESCILYELDTENRYFNSRLLMQLISEYDSIEFGECYYARKRALGEVYQLSAELKARNDIGTDDIVQIVTRKYQNQLQKLEPDNHEYIAYLRSQYLFSWSFANAFTSNYQIDELTVQDAFHMLDSKNNDNLQIRNRNRTTIVNQPARRIEKALMIFGKLNRSGHGDRKVWVRNDYFKAVELSSTITN